MPLSNYICYLKIRVPLVLNIIEEEDTPSTVPLVLNIIEEEDTPSTVPLVLNIIEEEDTPSKKRVTWREELEETRELDEILQIGKKREK